MMLSNIETYPIKKVVLFLKIVTSFVLLRPFGNRYLFYDFHDQNFKNIKTTNNYKPNNMKNRKIAQLNIRENSL